MARRGVVASIGPPGWASSDVYSIPGEDFVAIARRVARMGRSEVVSSVSAVITGEDFVARARRVARMGRSAVVKAVSAFVTGGMERQRAVVYCRALTQNLRWYPLLCPARRRRRNSSNVANVHSSTNLERTYTFI